MRGEEAIQVLDKGLHYRDLSADLIRRLRSDIERPRCERHVGKTLKEIEELEYVDVHGKRMKTLKQVAEEQHERMMMKMEIEEALRWMKKMKEGYARDKRNGKSGYERKITKLFGEDLLTDVIIKELNLEEELRKLDKSENICSDTGEYREMGKRHKYTYRDVKNLSALEKRELEMKKMRRQKSHQMIEKQRMRQKVAQKVQMAARRQDWKKMILKDTTKTIKDTDIEKARKLADFEERSVMFRALTIGGSISKEESIKVAEFLGKDQRLILAGQPYEVVKQNNSDDQELRPMKIVNEYGYQVTVD